ncbi:MAG: hypothetical protein KC910_06945 [Candidatus Eremiobacteraeota bacterium]|nr:hypothetical protein [Candidatus Eremiobacteraeota bacterium]
MRYLLAVLLASALLAWWTLPTRRPRIGDIEVDRTTITELNQRYGPGLKTGEWEVYCWRDRDGPYSLRVILGYTGIVSNVEYGLLDGTEAAPKVPLHLDLPAGLQFGDDLQTARDILGEQGYLVGERPGVASYNFTNWDVPHTFGQLRFVDGKLSKICFRID